MSAYLDKSVVINFFSELNSSKVSYILLKNIGNELPGRLKKGKDIDIVVDQRDKELFEKVMQRHFVKELPPYGIKNGWAFLYGLEEYQFWKGKSSCGDLYIDASFALACKGLMPNVWIPLDSKIQKRMWENRTWDKENNYWITDRETRFVYCIVRSIFDKKEFEKKYIDEIEKEKEVIDWGVVREILPLVVFKYADKLEHMIMEGKYDSIISEYISFTEY